MLTTMKAVRYYAPGGPQKLEYHDEDVPTTPEEGEVLIKVHAVGLIWTELYWPIYQDREGEYFSHIPGHDFSGVVTAVGAGCEESDVKLGSEVVVFSSKRNHEGAMAEYAKSDIDQVVLKPSNLSLAEAATVPLSALTAWQALFVHGGLQKGQRVLVTAAAGPTGVFAIQFAKQVGAWVTGTGSSASSRDLILGLGADEYIDYKKAGADTAVQDIDLALDFVGEKNIGQCFAVAKKGGRVVSIATYDAEEKGKEHGIHATFFIVSMDADQLRKICQMLEDGKIRTVVDKTYPLEKTREAFEDGAAGHGHGKTIITVP